MQIDKNILSNDLSPYLKQHKDNPVHWQTWSKNTLEKYLQIVQTYKKNFFKIKKSSN